MASDDEKEIQRLEAEIQAGERENSKLVARNDQLKAELRDLVDALKLAGISEEEIQRIISEGSEEDNDGESKA